MRFAERKALSRQLAAFMAEYGASKPAVFGSVARDPANRESRVEPFVDFLQDTNPCEAKLPGSIRLGTYPIG